MSDFTPLPLDGTAKIRERAARLLAKCRQRGKASLADLEQLKNDIDVLSADSDHWYQRADRFRESYRLAKGLSDDELNAQLAIDEAMRPHMPPCRFPSSPDCTCGGERS